VPADRLERMREQAASFGQAQLARAAETINAGLVEMRGATSPRLQLELICAQVLLPAPAAGEGALLARIERLEYRLSSGAAEAANAGVEAGQRGSPAARPARPEPAAQPEPAVSRTPPAQAPPSRTPPRDATGEAPGRPAGTGTSGADQIRERWPEVLDAVRHRSKVAWAQLSNATVDTLQDGILTLRFAQAGTATGFSARRSDEDLSQALEQVLGMSPKIRAVSASAREGSGGSGPGGADRGSRGGAGGVADGPRASREDAGNPGGSVSAGASAAAGPGTSERASRPDAGRARRPDRAAPAPPEEPDHDPAGHALTGMDLIQHTLGGRVIEEFGDA
jgi:DNA polymerase III subunit gamma/tau